MLNDSVGLKFLRGVFMSGIKVKNLTKVFGRRPTQALKHIADNKTKEEILKLTGMTVGVKEATFEVQAGEVFVIMGLSGSGKSTLVRMFNRLIEPTSGEVWLDDQNITTM